MIRTRTPKIIHGEAFDKVCVVLNMVHHVRRTDWDLCIPMVIWAYRTMCKCLTTQALSKQRYEVGAIVLVEHANLSLRITTTIDTMIRTDWNEEIT